MKRFAIVMIIVFIFTWEILAATETIWLEAEHFKGVTGSCFPDLQANETQGAWGMAGPGLAPEWTQGGESEWLSIGCGPAENKAVAIKEAEIPVAGSWRLWVRYRDWRKETELFKISIEQNGKTQEAVFGQKAVVDENDEIKLLWKWAFGWDMKEVVLEKGQAKIILSAHVSQNVHRQVDVICLTTDLSYRPYHREKPSLPVWETVEYVRKNPNTSPPLAVRTNDFNVAPSWEVKTFANKGFIYLWNVGDAWKADLASQDPKRILFPYNTDRALTNLFREMFGGKTDVPIFSDPRIVPTWHGAGPNILDDDNFVRWLEANPTRAWANMMNYIGPQPMTDKAKANWEKYKERYVGNISGENLGYFDWDAKLLNEKIKTAKSREEVLKILTEIFMQGVAEKQKIIFGQYIEKPYFYTIPCQSCDMPAYCHVCYEWGARTVGFENHAVAPSLAMRMAFLRGAARQYGGMIATYRSCNFGDAATIYTDASLYPGQRYIYDNSYDPWAGAGMTWYKFDIWHQYMSGSSMFYHEQGFDEFWAPAGGSTAQKPLQLSPKGRLIDDFLKITTKHRDRGIPFTPIAFLLDIAHGWDPTSYIPGYFGQDPSLNPDVLSYDNHAKMLKEWFRVAYHPYAINEASVNNGVNQPFIAGVFGNIFDVIVTSQEKTDIADSYPVIILNGKITLSEKWGKKLADYMAKGGTLVVSADQLEGEGASMLGLPEKGQVAESDKIKWLKDGSIHESQRYRYYVLKDGEALAHADNGDVIASSYKKGAGNLIFISVPMGLGINGFAVPLVALVINGVQKGLLPFEIEGDVEWMLNKTANSWLITLINPAGCNKPQHGVIVTDYSQERNVKIICKVPCREATEWFEEAILKVENAGGKNIVSLTVPAAGVRIVEVK